MTAVIADRLACAKARPLVVEDAVRIALRDVVAWRIGGGTAPQTAAFIAAAISAARLQLDASGSDSSQRSRTLAAVQQSARRFAASKLCRRLMTVPASQFLRLPLCARGPDVVLRDRRNRLHAIVLTASSNGLDAGRIASGVAAATALPVAQRLLPLTVHVFSLATGTRHAFDRDVRRELISARTERVA